VICCGHACQFATFHGDDPDLDAPVLERVCATEATIMEQPATAAQPPRNEVARTMEMSRPKRKGSREPRTHDLRDRRLRQHVVAGLGQAADTLPAISSARQTKH
jgi:hypothetical protein